MSLCWLCESWKAGLICTAGLTASAGVMPRCCLSCHGTYIFVFDKNTRERSDSCLMSLNSVSSSELGCSGCSSACIVGLDNNKFVFKVPPEPSLDLEVAGHLLGEGAVCDVRRLEPLAELGHSEDAFVGNPAPGLILTYQGEEEERKGKDSLGAAIHIDARQLRQVPEVRGIVDMDWKSHDLAIFNETPMYIVNESIEAFIYFSRD